MNRRPEEALDLGDGDGVGLLLACANACIATGGDWYMADQMATILGECVGNPALNADAAFISMATPEQVAALITTLRLAKGLIDSLADALKAVITMDVGGHQLQDRLQFSDAGRAILSKIEAVRPELDSIGSQS